MFAIGGDDQEGGLSKMAGKFADMAGQAYLKAGRGGLDALELKGQDIKGFEGAPRGAEGKALGGEALQDAVSRSSVGGLGEVLGQNFENRSFEVARRMGMGIGAGRPERDGFGLGE
ncbi:MAG: hypothetical protein H6872_05890 [Methylobacteriaceae bacterium]|nr:hypothetical protein [Methylobacteriaceae bacterium]